MGKKFYMKEGVGFEGISMMEETKSKIPRLMIIIGVVIVGIAILGFGASKVLTTQQTPTPTPGVTILPTSSRDAEPTSDAAGSGQAVSPTGKTTNSPTPTPKKQASPTPTRKPSPKLSPTVTVAATTKQLNVAVLNGSGTKGAASTMASDLSESGYTVVRTGNANAFTYTGVSVDIKKSKSKSLDQLKKDLSVNGYLVTSTTSTLPETDTADAVIIVGAEE